MNMKRTDFAWSGLALGGLLCLATVEASRASDEPADCIEDAPLSSQQLDADWLAAKTVEIRSP